MHSLLSFSKSSYQKCGGARKRKCWRNSRLQETVPNPRNPKVWREQAREREFRAPTGSPRCRGLCAKPAVIGDFSAAKSSGELWLQQDWRREWDSNPRYGFPYTRFPSVRLQPLGHLSVRTLMTGQRLFFKSGRGESRLAPLIGLLWLLWYSFPPSSEGGAP